MTEDLWADVDRYIVDHVVPADPALDGALDASIASGLPAIAVSAAQGKFLHLLARVHGARRILEIGTLGGYSTIWMARALPPGGQLITLEADPKHAEVARANIARAGLANVVDVRLGPALETLPKLSGSFDLVFIDADKENIPHYFDWSLKLSRAGSIIIVDNVVREGAVIDLASDDERVKAVRRFMDQLAAERRVDATVLQTVGSKGYDGFAMAVVVST